jgi:dual specificity tyrosine-phosphorylation-regulated kinase 1
MIPDDMLNQVDEKNKVKFFERPSILSREWVIKRKDKQQERIVPSSDPISSLKDILQTEERKMKANEKGGGSSPGVNYDMFVDLIYRMLTYDPLERISPDEAMQHPFIVANEHSLSRQASNGTSAVSSRRY